MLECRVILVCSTPFVGHTPSVVINLFGQLTVLLGIIIVTSRIISPNIYIDEVKHIFSVAAEDLMKFIKARFSFSCGKVIDTVKSDSLIDPVPSITKTSVLITANIIILKRFCFRIHLACIDMDTEFCSVIRAFFKQCLHIFRSADSLSYICVIRMRRVMSFIRITFQQDRLSKTVCVHCHTFYVI